MIDVITSAFSRSDVAARIWPEVRARAGCPIRWSIAIDGDPAIPWHDVEAVASLARQYADVVTILGAHRGCGAGAQAARTALGAGGAHIRLDADLLPSPDFARACRDTFTAWDDGRLGLLVALHWPHSSRADVGPRRMPACHRLNTGLAYISEAGSAAIADYTTQTLIGDLDMHICMSMAEAGLWCAYSHRVWWDEHHIHPPDTYPAYHDFKAAVLTRKPSTAMQERMQRYRGAL